MGVYGFIEVQIIWHRRNTIAIQGVIYSRQRVLGLTKQ